MPSLNDILSAAPVQKPVQDARALNSLRQTARTDPRAAIEQAASEFESLFTRQLLKSMRASLPKSGLFDGPGRETMTQMLDDQLAQITAGAEGGLGKLIARHLSRYVDPGSAADSSMPMARQTHGSASPAGDATASPERAQGTADTTNSLMPVSYRPADPLAAFRPDLNEVVERAKVVLENVPAWLNAAVQPEPPLSGLPASRRSELFVERLMPHATAAQASTGVPAPFIIGQAALESGWGRGEIRRPDGTPAYNLFGIKAGSSWRGDAVAVTTTEYVEGRPVLQKERFRAYDSYAEAFTDWARLMRENPRYAGVLQAADSVRDFAYGLQDAGYATDPRYGRKLEQVINKAIEIQHEREAARNTSNAMHAPRFGS